MREERNPAAMSASELSDWLVEEMSPYITLSRQSPAVDMDALTAARSRAEYANEQANIWAIENPDAYALLKECLRRRLLAANNVRDRRSGRSA